MKRKRTIGCLGAGTWGSALANQLAKNGHNVKLWNRNKEFLNYLKSNREHPKLKGNKLLESIVFEDNIERVIEDSDIIVESVTSQGIRFVFEKVLEVRKNSLCPIVITSKGIEQHTGLLFPEVALEILKEENRDKIAVLSGPSHAEEVMNSIPTLVVCSAYDSFVMDMIFKVFKSTNFRVYPNSDILGVSFGGAMKNIIAIACAISDGLNFGDNTRAALITRGLHELKKLAKFKGCRKETLNGLSGLGDLLVTCTSTLSRNYRFGKLLAQGCSVEEAKGQIGMVVEGAYTCVSAMELGQKNGVALPITEAIYNVLYKNLSLEEAVKSLLNRVIKEEHL